MQVNSINNTTFGAKLDVSGMTTNKARWKNIARIFEEKTKNNKDGLVELWNAKSTFGGRLYINCIPIVNEKADELYLEGTKSIADNLLKLSDEKVAGKFAKLFKTAEKLVKDKFKAIDFVDKFSTKYKNVKDEDVIFETIYSPMIDIFLENAKQKVAKDSIFRNCRVLF